MINPTPERIREMVRRFREYESNHPYAGPVDMNEPEIYEYSVVKHPNFCGTPGCHAGLFAVLFGEGKDKKYHASSWFEGINIMQKFLFSDENISLEYWAKENPELWGNGCGGHIFADAMAFGGELEDSPYNTVSINTIAAHWEAVADRIEKLESKEK